MMDYWNNEKTVLDGLVKSLKRLFSVIPAQVGIQYFHVARIFWIPVFTGMTTFYDSIILLLLQYSIVPLFRFCRFTQ